MGGLRSRQLLARWRLAVKPRGSDMSRLSEFIAQHLSNTAWAFATADWRDEGLLLALAQAVKLRLGKFGAQHVSNTV